MEQSKNNLLLQLNSTKFIEQVKAIEQLANNYSKDEEVLLSLIKLFIHETHTLQTHAIVAVRQIVSNFDNNIIEAELLPTLCKRMQSSFQITREPYKELLLLIKTIKQLENKQIIEILIKNSSNPLLSERSIEALSEIAQPDDRIIEAVYIALKHTNEHIKKAAIAFLKKHNLPQDQALKDEILITDEEIEIARQLQISELQKKLIEHDKHSAFQLQNTAEKLIELLEVADEKHELKALIITTLLRNLDTQDPGIQQRAARSLADMKHHHPKVVITLIRYYFNPTNYLPYTPLESKDFCRRALIQLGYKLDKLNIVLEALTQNNLLKAIVQHRIETTQNYLSVLPLPEDLQINCKKIVNHELVENNSINDGILYNQTLSRIAPDYYVFYQNLGCFEHAAAQQTQNSEEKQNLLISAENNFKKSIELKSCTSTLVEYSLFLVVNQRYEEAKRYLSTLSTTDEKLNYSYEMNNTLTDILKTIIEETIEIQIPAITLGYYLLLECHYYSAQGKAENLRKTDYAHMRLNFNKLKKQFEITPCDFAEPLISLIQEKFSIALPKTETKPTQIKTNSSSKVESLYVANAEQVVVMQGNIDVSGTNQIHGFFANKLKQSSSTIRSDTSNQDGAPDSNSLCKK